MHKRRSACPAALGAINIESSRGDTETRRLAGTQNITLLIPTSPRIRVGMKNKERRLMLRVSVRENSGVLTETQRHGDLPELKA